MFIMRRCNSRRHVSRRERVAGSCEYASETNHACARSNAGKAGNARACCDSVSRSAAGTRCNSAARCRVASAQTDAKNAVAISCNAVCSSARSREQSCSSCVATSDATCCATIRTVADSDFGSGLHAATASADYTSSIDSACAGRFANCDTDPPGTGFACAFEHTARTRRASSDQSVPRARSKPSRKAISARARVGYGRVLSGETF